MNKYPNLIIILSLSIILLIIFILKINRIIFLDYYTNAWILSLISTIGIITYLKSFSHILKSIWWLVIITFPTIMITSSAWYYMSDFIPSIFGPILFIITLATVASLTIRILEWKCSYNIYIKVILSYMLTMIFIWHSLLALWMNWWLYFKDLDLLETKCVNEQCIDLYNAEFKYNYINIYYYNKNNSIIKYNWNNPILGIWKDHQQEIVTKVKNIVDKSTLSIEDWNYYLNYENLEWEHRNLIIND